MKFKIFEKSLHLQYGLSEKKDGFMNIKLSGNEDFDKKAIENRNLFIKNNHIRGRIIFPYLMHGSEVAVINENDLEENIKADSFITNIPDVFLTITVADCFPVYFFDSNKNIVGLAHCGWRGIAGDIIKNTMDVFKKWFDSEPDDIFVVVGPGIQKCHFDVRDDVIQKFKAYERFVIKNKEYYKVDLTGILTEQLLLEGVKNIENNNECTYCLADKYFSYRRDKTNTPQTMLAYIGKSDK